MVPSRLVGGVRWLVFALLLGVSVSVVSVAQAANVTILTHDTGVDIEALLTASAALLGATLVIVLAYAFGFRLIMAIWNKSRAFFAAR